MKLSEPIFREKEADQLLQALTTSNCASVIGLSNMGKSMLMRSMRGEEIAARYREETRREGVFTYLDCNGMLDLSGQGFYELVLRGMQESIRHIDPEVEAALRKHYQQVIEPDSPFVVPLSFNNAITAFIEDGGRDLILMLDEFDEAFDALDGRVFLNLRALRDRYPHRLMYVTATVRRLNFKRGDEQTAEFVELSAAHTFTVRPLNRAETDAVAAVFEQEEIGVEGDLSPAELDFLWQQTGGHPGLSMAVISRLVDLRAAAESPASQAAAWQDVLVRDVTIRTECTHLWSQLSTDERETLLAVAVGTLDNRFSRALQSLEEWGLTITQADGTIIPFCDLFADFVRRQATIQRELPEGIWLDEDAGEVWVSGVPVEALTELEFKLIKLLYQRMNKITDKYQIVETVWGVDYIEQVDDARIEKLVSRLRSKIEPDPSNPRYLLTMRGRGYKLSDAE